MWKMIRGYLTFTRKERLGVLFLLVVMSILFILPYYFEPKPGDPDRAMYEKYKDKIGAFESGRRDGSDAAVTQNRYNRRDSSQKERNASRPVGNVPLFYFDPNRVDARTWQRLGLSDRLSQTISRYVERGGQFRRADDLKKIYGLHADDYQRLFPFVRIAGKETERAIVKDTSRGGYPKSRKRLVRTEVNDADSTAWMALPGIGIGLSRRIIRYREKLGGFYRVDQVAETFGLPDSVFRNIQPVLWVDTSFIHRIDLNNATEEILKEHPYIRWRNAKAIVTYRTQYGKFSSVDELLNIAVIDPDAFEKIKHYVVADP